MRLAIADPPYPPFIGSGGRKNRASRWYGNGQRSWDDHRLVADHHQDADRWDDPREHRLLLERLCDSYDGWAIATSPDGLAAYHPLPAASRILVWIKPNAIPGAHRIRCTWEPVVVLPPTTRRSNRGGSGMVSDILTANAPRQRFTGSKPPAWTRFVLDALGYDPETDTVADLFPGSGAIQQEVRRGVLM